MREVESLVCDITHGVWQLTFLLLEPADAPTDVHEVIGDGVAWERWHIPSHWIRRCWSQHRKTMLGCKSLRQGVLSGSAGGRVCLQSMRRMMQVARQLRCDVTEGAFSAHLERRGHVGTLTTTAMKGKHHREPLVLVALRRSEALKQVFMALPCLT